MYSQSHGQSHITKMLPCDNRSRTRPYFWKQLFSEREIQVEVAEDCITLITYGSSHQKQKCESFQIHEDCDLQLDLGRDPWKAAM